MKKYILSILLLLTAAYLSAANPLKSGDDYAAMFNEHLNKGIHSGITTSVELPLYAYGEQMLTLQDTANGGIAGYLYNGYMIIDSMQIDSAFCILREGIAKYPDRLDLYLGLATGYLYCLDSKNMIEVVGLALQRERKNKGKWLWSNNERLAKTEDILFSRVQEDYSRFVEADQLDDAERLANIAVEYFPKRAEYWNDLAGIYFYRKDYKTALEYFHKALKLSPNDDLIKANISYVEELLNQQK